MSSAARSGWRELTEGWPWFTGEGRFPIPAYSEFMPPPRVGLAPYGPVDPLLFDAEDPFGWRVTEYEEAFELAPGFGKLAENLLDSLENLAQGRRAHGIPKHHLIENPFWPDVLSQAAGKLAHERCVLLLSLALSRTQDDKGRLRWTLFGVSEQGPARAFWQSCFSAPGVEWPEAQATDWLRRLLAGAYGVSELASVDLRRAGLRILPTEPDPRFPEWREEPLPGWTRPLLLQPDQPIQDVRWLLTFRPFARLPAPVQRAYLDGALHLLPFPGSLVFWGVPQYRKLASELPFATQIPLLHLIERREAPSGIRVPQSGWLHEPKPGQLAPDAGRGPLRNTIKRTHRWARVLRHQDELELTELADRVAQVLFSTCEDDVRLYGKPMARNAQIWSSDYRRVLDGPTATPEALKAAVGAINLGGHFGYRFHYPAMRVGHHEIYWQRPLAAFRDPQTGRTALLGDGPLGWLTAYDTREEGLAHPVELWPRLLARPPHLAAVEIVARAHTSVAHEACNNARRLLSSSELLESGRLSSTFARALLNAGEDQSLESWLEQLPERTGVPEPSRRLASELRTRCSADPEPTPPALTYARTARRSFEIQYWKTIASLAEGRYRTKNNADCVLDAPTKKRLDRERRDLGELGDHLLRQYRALAAAGRRLRGALVGELPFAWRTDFEYTWMGGWLENQGGRANERNLIVVIPGRDRSQAVIMADHYDTAYMEDCYEPAQGGDRARIAAAGADDNHSATAALLCGAPILLDLSRAGKLACDVWLIHLTGEEFPADCLGARHLCQSLVEGRLALRTADGAAHDLSGTRVRGVYVLDMIAHNRDSDRDDFQIAPGSAPGSLWLAHQAHLANRIWNESTARWNRRASRRKLGRGRRRKTGSRVPAIARHLALRGEVRPEWDPRSSLYNTDGQIFSDAGVPVVLFMENYDINRSGYHDTHDTLANIDLDYGAALAAIAIESVARAASADWR